MQRYMWRFGILVPVWFSVYLFAYGLESDVYIPALHLQLWSYDVVLGYVVFALLWTALSPLRDCCCDGSVFEFLYYFFPVGLWCTLYMAQHDFAAVVYALILILVLSLIITCREYRHYRRLEVPINARVRSTIAYVGMRGFLLVSCGIFLASFLFLFRIDSIKPPVLTPTKEIVEPVTVEERRNYDAEIWGITALQPKCWRKFSQEERLNALQALSNIEAAKLGIPSCSVVSTVLTYGDSAYSKEKGQIIIAVELLENIDSEEDSIRAMLWGLYIRYIDYLIDNVDFDHPIYQTAYFSTIREYRDNLTSFTSPSPYDSEGYYAQPIIRDSEAYAKEEAARVISLMNEEGSV